ncbi:DnaA/Hda family protein [Hyphomicrobiales bacterium 4NK60-0047b]|jgi:chromosomal replication initiation ATPase DnaA
MTKKTEANLHSANGSGLSSGVNEASGVRVSSPQLTLDFQHRPALGLENFFVSNSNQAAIELIDQWPNWPAPAMFLQGPVGSGKSHLAHVWQMASGARLLKASDFKSSDLAEGEDDVSAMVIEDIDEGIRDEHALFHLINLAKEKGFTLLFTSVAGPGQISIELPDLRSRIRALAVVSINAPDDMLLRFMLLKQFEDRQLEVTPQLIEYILPRMERSFEGVGLAVEMIDKAALATGRKLTRQFVGEILRLNS